MHSVNYFYILSCNFTYFYIHFMYFYILKTYIYILKTHWGTASTTTNFWPVGLTSGTNVPLHISIKKLPTIYKMCFGHLEAFLIFFWFFLGYGLTPPPYGHWPYFFLLLFEVHSGQLFSCTVLYIFLNLQ